MTTVSFSDLALDAAILEALHEEGYSEPTPIQAQSIPHLLEGRDLLGCAQTGTGKTAAFALPILQRLVARKRKAKPRSPRVLVLSPTRELASQIGQSFETYGCNIPFRHATIFGGVSQNPQVQAMHRGVDVLIATPGRLLDLMDQKHIRLDKLEVFVLDEADRMLDMGFLPAIRRIIRSLPEERQSLFFTATLPPDIAELAEGLLTDPVRVEVTPQSSTVERIEQRVMFVERSNKKPLLCELLEDRDASRVLVFARTKRSADVIARQLRGAGFPADAIHGNKSQSARERALRGFRGGRVQVLVATDLAARGIDVDGVTHVVNYDLPLEPESYVHRIGRTGRAGATGVAVSFCDASERSTLRAIERLIQRPIEIDADHAYHCAAAATATGSSKAPAGESRRPRRKHFRPRRRRQPA